MKLLVRSGILGRHSMRKHDRIIGTEKKVHMKFLMRSGILSKYSMRKHDHKYSTASRSTRQARTHGPGSRGNRLGTHCLDTSHTLVLNIFISKINIYSRLKDCYYKLVTNKQILIKYADLLKQYHNFYST